MSYSKLLIICCLAGTIAMTAPALLSMAGDQTDRLTPKQLLGKMLYFDPDLSEPKGQSCASCHQPGAGFTDPDGTLPVSFGVIEERTGGRNSPSAAYAAYSPRLHFDQGKQRWVGGQFWDGRSMTLVEQAKGPFLNPVEMNNPDKAAVVRDIRKSSYATLFKLVYGLKSLDNANKAYDFAADAIAAYESSSEVCAFTSKFDYYLKGKATLTEQEAFGLEVFTRSCSSCHPVDTPSGAPGPLLTDFSYANLGVPRNMDVPAYAQDRTLRDLGLGATLGDPRQNGMFKTPTLRNVAVTAPYTHNGFTPSMKAFLVFRRAPELYGEPEVSETPVMGRANLTDEEIDALVLFMRTLTDGYVPRR
jgi:cytochrome c peroxidase